MLVTMFKPQTHSRWLAPERWHTRQHLASLPTDKRPCSTVYSWLIERASLTARLQYLASGNFQVHVICEGWAKPTHEEQRALNMPAREYAWIREVMLRGNAEDWVQARSILPRRSLIGVGKRLTRLGNRSLGSLLFRDPGLKRGAISIATIKPSLAHKPYWARRSRLTLRNHSVLVAEAFLPALFAAELAQKLEP